MKENLVIHVCESLGMDQEYSDPIKKIQSMVELPPWAKPFEKVDGTQEFFVRAAPRENGK